MGGPGGRAGAQKAGDHFGANVGAVRVAGVFPGGGNQLGLAFAARPESAVASQHHVHSLTALSDANVRRRR